MPPVDSSARELPADAEWLLVDGRSGYACGCVDDRPRRRYHGLWNARAGEDSTRYSVVAGLDERVAVGAEEVSLLHARWAGLPGAVPPPVATRFRHRPWPSFAFDHAAFRLRREILLRRDDGIREPALLVRWRNEGGDMLRLAVRPLLGWCSVDHLPPVREDFADGVEPRGASWGVRPDPSLPTLWLTANGIAAFRSEPGWYRDFVYDLDRERGYDHVGHRYCPGVVEFDLPPGREAVLSFSLGEPIAEPAAAWAEAAAEARARQPRENGFRGRLEASADDFFYRAAGGRLGVLAGFPWFGEWGRDVFLALPGLTLSRGRPELCARVLSDALPFLWRGLLPNIYAATPAESHYGSCDAALWFALAVQRYATATGDEVRVRDEYLPALVDIAEHYLAGTDLGMVATGDGLLAAGGPDLNATWMDAQTARGPVTPRQGLPVEIQALWYSLLSFLGSQGHRRFARIARRCKQTFVERFWLDDGRYLADRVDGGAADRTVRPNMLVAAALPRSPLVRAQRAGVVEKAEAELVTPRGLRTLSPSDSGYRGRYGGGIEARDSAYHQGTVWPWLSGFYVEAALAAATKAQRAKARARLRVWLLGMSAELDRAGIDHISEVFDGDPPQRPGGTFAQAWNSGELLRALELVEAGDPERP